MVALLRPVTALFISAALVLCGNGLETILLPYRATLEGFSRLQIGLIGSAYWLGITIGCLICPTVIARVGHPRAFSVFTAIATVSPLLEAIWQAPAFWWLTRAVTGACFAGILMVIESWINSVAPNEKRGKILSTYTLVNFGSIVVGQELMTLAPPSGFQLFSMVALLFSISAIPLAQTLTPAPAAPHKTRPRPLWLWRMSPASFVGCLTAGLANGAFWALGPLYAKESGMPAASVALFMTSAVMGGALAQWPIGVWSDRMDRRLMLMGIALSAALTGALLFAIFATQLTALKLGLAFCFGASALPVYSVSLAHANDHAGPARSVDASSNLLLILASAGIAGPIFGSLVASHGGAGSIFLYTAIVHFAMAAFCFLRTRTREAVPIAERETYTVLPIETSTSVFELDPRAQEKAQ